MNAVEKEANDNKSEKGDQSESEQIKKSDKISEHDVFSFLFVF